MADDLSSGRRRQDVLERLDAGALDCLGRCPDPDPRSPASRRRQAIQRSLSLILAAMRERASDQSRSTERSDSPRLSAVSDTVKPAK